MSSVVLTLLIALFDLLLKSCFGLSMVDCHSTFVNVNITSPSNQITCEWAQSTDVVLWRYNDARVVAGSIICEQASGCSANSYFTATRSLVSSSSRLTFDLNITIFRSVYGAMTVSCLIYASDTGPDQPTESVSCDVDVIHASEVTSCNVSFNTPQNAQWTVSGSCDVSKTFSQRGRYSCQWSQVLEGISTEVASTLNLTGSFDEGGVTYRTMTCDFSAPFPLQAGSHSYTAVISPGGVEPEVNFRGSSDIVLPSLPTTNCPTDYVKRGDDVDCKCSVTSPGSPVGTVVWEGRQGSRLLLSEVNSGNHGNNYTCVVKWGFNDVRQKTFTLQVAHGPTAVTINGPQQPFDTDGTKVMTFTCTANDFRPGVSYQWRHVPDGSSWNSNSYQLQNVGRDDDGAVIRCTATNSRFSSLQTSANFTLDLHYPPISPPVIHNSTSQGFVYQGDSLTLTCTVTGSKPVSSTSVTFVCPGKTDTGDVTSTTDVSSSVTYSAVAASDNGAVCTCGAQWKSYDWYTLTASTAINVYYPPSVPLVHPGSQPYPFLSGESPTLFCVYPATSDPGNPAATLTLNGHVGIEGQGEVSVILTQLSPNDNRKPVTCSASNAYTVHTSTLVSTNFTLQVYYPPVVTVMPLPSNECSLSSSTAECMVQEGDRVHVNCTAHSNPDIQSVAWQQTSTSVLDLQADRGMDMTYTCDAVTRDNGDSRLPLSASLRLRVVVLYEAQVTSLKVNNEDHVTTRLTEEEAIAIKCTTRGRPEPHVVLIKDGATIASKSQGSYDFDDVVFLTTLTSSAGCDDTGQYTCQAGNGIGQSANRTVWIFVDCPPRPQPGAGQPPAYINVISTPVTLTYRLMSYPPPHLNTLYITHSASQAQTPARTTLYLITCQPSGGPQLFLTTCSLIIHNASKTDAGLYIAKFANTLGETSFQFQLDVDTEEGSTGDSHSPGGLDTGAAVGVGIGVTVMVVAVVLGVVVVWLWRRNWLLPCAHSSQEYSHSSGNDEPSRSAPPPPASAASNNDVCGEQDAHVQDVSEEPNNYEQLRLQDIGLRSVYTDFSAKQKTASGPTLSEQADGQQSNPYVN